MRITLDNDKALKLASALETYESKLREIFTKDEIEYLTELRDSIFTEYKKVPSSKKRAAAQKATTIRQDRVKEKIRNAINLLHLENAKINTNSVAKKAGVSYNTAKKYSYLIYQID